MTRDEAREILHACRPGRRDGNDPRVAAALAFAETDPELRQWFEEWQQWDAGLGRALQQTPVPDGLREQVLRGAAKRVRERARPNRMPLALAAGLALLGVLIALWMTRPGAPAPDSIAALRLDMAEFLAGSPGVVPRLDIATDRLPEVREWLAGQHAIAEARFPEALEQFPSIGCRTVEWRGHRLALVCFMVEGEVVHFFMIPRAAFPETGGLGSAPQYARAGRFATATWVGEDRVFLAVTPGSQAFLKRWL